MIAEKEGHIQGLHTEVYELQDRYKEQIKDREEIILQHTTTNAEYSKKLVELENKIQTLEKRNEKQQNETVDQYEKQIKTIDHKAKEQIKDINIKVSEQNESLDKMQEVGQKKLKYELELMAWQQDCKSLETAYQEEKYLIEIELARMKKSKQAEFQQSLDQSKLQAK